MSVRLPLRTIRESQRAVARIIRMRYQDEIDSAMYRDLVYGLNANLAHLKVQAELDIGARLDAIEEALSKGGNAREQFKIEASRA